MFCSAMLVASAPAWAQGPAPTRIRGTVAALNGLALVVHARGGRDETITLGPNPMVTAVTITKLADVHPGSFIGTAAVAQPDGTLRALEVHIFPREHARQRRGQPPVGLRARRAA